MPEYVFDLIVDNFLSSVVCSAQRYTRQKNDGRELAKHDACERRALDRSTKLLSFVSVKEF